MYSDTIQSFRGFVQRSRALLQHGAEVQALVKEFRAFVQRATPLVITGLLQDHAELHRRLLLLCRWFTSQDLLQAAGLHGDENCYTRLLGWALYPKGHSEIALRCQRAWLRSLGITLECVTPARPQVQFATTDGIPDLVLDYGRDVLITEVKTNTSEHELPSGVMQTTGYAEAVISRLPGRIPHVVFLTPAGDAAANPEAANTTFLGFVLALAEELTPEQLPLDLRWAYSHLFTHLLQAVPPKPLAWDILFSPDCAAAFVELSEGRVPSRHLYLLLRTHDVLMKAPSR